MLCARGRRSRAMRAEIDGMLVVRAELCDRLDSLQRAAARMNVRDFTQGVAAIRTMAAAYGLVPVVCLCDGLDRAGRAPPLPVRPLFRAGQGRDRLRAPRRGGRRGAPRLPLDPLLRVMKNRDSPYLIGIR